MLFHNATAVVMDVISIKSKELSISQKQFPKSKLIRKSHKNVFVKALTGGLQRQYKGMSRTMASSTCLAKHHSTRLFVEPIL